MCGTTAQFGVRSSLESVIASKLLSEAGSAEDIRLTILWKEIHA